MVRSSILVLAIAFCLEGYPAPQALAASASPTALSFQAVQGGTSPTGKSVNVSKSGKKTTSWTASDSASWVSVSPPSGSITDTTQITVTVNTASLAPGTYSATVAVTLSQGGNVSIPVSLTVTPATTTPTTSTSTTSASLTWSPPATTTALAGYKVYKGTAPGVYGSPVDIGNVTSYTASNLGIGYTYYFVVTSYDGSGNESLPSNEVSKVIY